MQQNENDKSTFGPPISSLISSGERLMRRVPYQPKYFKNNKVQQGTFLPRKYDRDKDGLSLSRLKTSDHNDFLTPDLFKLNCADEKMRRTAGVLLILVDDVWELVGPLVRPDPAPAQPERGLFADPGHVIIPEINSRQTDDGPDSTLESRERIRVMAAALAHRYSDTKHFAILPGDPPKAL